MVDRDPFRFPPQNNPLLLQYLTNLEQQGTVPGAALPATGLPVDTGCVRTPTNQSAAYAYNMHRSLEQQLMARFLQNSTLPQDSAPLAGEPGLQFDDAHM